MHNGRQCLTRVALATRCTGAVYRSRCLTLRWQSTDAVVPTVPSRKWSTPLAQTISKAIEVTGPISVAAYMRQCLTSPDGGYYTTTQADTDQFGKQGDFVTSPEISQVFGELVGLWFMTEWMGQGWPAKGVQFMELGPGRGTLMADILRTISQFRSFIGAVEAVWLVEASDGLREKQKELLCGREATMKESKAGDGSTWWECPSTYGDRVSIRWVPDVALLPGNDPGQSVVPFIVAHEFFDALPIHAFESVPPNPHASQSSLLNGHGSPVARPSDAGKAPQWRELLVSTTRDTSLLHSSTTTPTEPAPEFHLTLAKASNPLSAILPGRARYRKLQDQPGSRIEISPESSRYVQDIARRIGGDHPGAPTSNKTPAGALTNTGKPQGAALVIDYGPADTVPIDSLRGIKSHKIISPFVLAGQADISADVDFGALADAALEASTGVEVHGPVEQGTWLTQLGIQQRAEKLMDGVSDARRKKDIETGWKRLVEGGPKGMGKAYKVMAILPENSGKRRPVGFGGDVAG